MSTTTSSPRPSRAKSTTAAAPHAPTPPVAAPLDDDAAFAAILAEHGLHLVTLDCVELAPAVPDLPSRPITPDPKAQEAYARLERAHAVAVAAAAAFVPRTLPGPSGAPLRLTLRSVESTEGRIAYAEAAAAIATADNDPAAIDAANDRIIAGSVVGWTLPVPCTPERVAQLFTAVPWVRRLLDVVLNDTGRFLGRPTS